MTHAAPIPALLDYYRRLADDPNEDIAAYGFSRQKISFRVVLEPDGQLHAIQDAREQVGSRRVPASMVVPGQSKPSGSGINPCFLWDNGAYTLGYRTDDPKPERTLASFEAFRDRHLALEDEIADPHFTAVCRFLRTWKPAAALQATGGELLEELGGGFGVFQIRSHQQYVHQREKVLAYWEKMLDSSVDGQDDGGPVGQSLASGRVSPLARLHEPKIKGVIGGQSSGAVLVGFNDDAYTSYGKKQSYNAPIAEDEAFAYCTALNRLLDRADRRVRLGDATAVFWSEQPTTAEELVAFFMGNDNVASQSAEDEGLTTAVGAFLDAVRRGVPHGGLKDTDTPFYILGLSPNAARISVRFWLPGTVGEFGDRLAQHVRDLEIVGGQGGEPLTIRRMLWETAREAKDIPPQLAGEVARAILSGRPYPLMLYTALIRRIRADRTMNTRRAAIVKACLTRNYEMEVSVALDKTHSGPAYHMGRLFAALEKTQQDTAPSLNKTIKDGYFGTASAMPASVFPRLIRLHQHHIEKLDGGLKVNRERLIQEICGHIKYFPHHLPLEQQGLFHLGYYHQRQDLFTKKDRNGDSAVDEPQPITTSEEPRNA